MNENLKQAVLSYEQEEMKGVHPISEIDADIIVEIGEALRKLGNDELKRIVCEWKSLQDKEVLDMLIQWNLDNEEEVKADDKFRKNFILFDGLTIDVHYVVSISKKSHFDYNEGEMVYEIVINEKVNEKYHYYDTRIPYVTEKERDERYNKLHEILMDTDTINFH